MGKTVVLPRVLQLRTRKRYVYGAIAFIWIVIPATQITFVTLATDIVNGTCLVFGAYQSYAMKKSIGFFGVFISYFLPLSLMVFCYTAIIHTLRSKVVFALALLSPPPVFVTQQLYGRIMPLFATSAEYNAIQVEKERKNA